MKGSYLMEKEYEEMNESEAKLNPVSVTRSAVVSIQRGPGQEPITLTDEEAREVFRALRKLYGRKP